MSKRAIPNDELYTNQWHLHNTKKQKAKKGVNINVEPAWDSVTGKGRTIAIVDDGLQLTHPDLRANVAKRQSGLHYNYNNGNPENPNPRRGDNHETPCAGVAAAVGNNKKGVVGAAYNARLVGRRLVSQEFTSLQTADALLRGSNDVDIVSNSWGPINNGKVLDQQGPYRIELEILKRGVLLGRNGKGLTFTWAAGNGRGVGYGRNGARRC